MRNRSRNGTATRPVEPGRLLARPDLRTQLRDGPGPGDFGPTYDRVLEAGDDPYTKPVVCILGPGCVSSGEGFAKMMACLPHVATVGLPTRGSSGNPAPVDVGETGLRVYFSRWVDLMPDGTPIEGTGIPPALVVAVAADRYKDADPTLVKGLEILRARTTGAK